MDIKEYIASGIIDSYVLGFSSDQERREVECMSSIYPELKEELTSTQLILEKYALSLAIAPPTSLKDKIMELIRNTTQESTASTDEPTVSSGSQAKVIRVVPNSWRIGVAASIAALIGIGILYVSQRNTVSDLQERIAQVETQSQKEQNALKNQLASLELSLNETEELKQFIMHEHTDEIVLAGTAISPESKVRAYWNTEVANVVMIADKLPTPEEGKQYQLWAISNGTPMDLGVMDKAAVMSSQITVSTKDVQAFAITLEKEGGSPTPTLEQMYVVGTVKG